MDVLWLLLLGLFLAGWFVLDGFDLGIGITLPWLARDAYGRREVFTAFGPFFLANEIWLVGAAGLLAGAFPHAERDLLGAYYPLVVALLAGWVLRDAAVWFRSRLARPGWRGFWDILFTGASLLFVISWGLLLGNLLQGGAGRPGVVALLDPFSLLVAVTVGLVLATHGATFAAARLAPERAGAAVVVARRTALPAAVALLVCVPAAAVQGGVRAAVSDPVPAVVAALVGAGALLVARVSLARGGHRRAFAATAVAAAAPVLGTGFGVADRLLAGVTGTAALDRLMVVVLPVVPVLLLVQLVVWWTFRRRIDGRSPAFF
ncbi:cytochrome d ubiquinol oxidase subunit II [Plantactinospora siamensis]|uniref:Cytochrome d ubiquinol oxidase subunit II n=1 Tax=Plantactinospora siamensis TaxID=555372 RepID=A0ABV6NXS5_9ACTN